MHYLFRLAALCLVLFAGVAQAVTEEKAMRDCLAQAAVADAAYGSSSTTGGRDRCVRYYAGPGGGYAPNIGQYRLQTLPTNAVMNYWFDSQTCDDGSAFVVGATCASTPPTEAQCLARNKPDIGDPDGRGAANRYYIVGTAPTSYCNSKCDLAVGSAIRTFSGVNPNTGAPVQWGEHEQTYAGTVCTTPVMLDQDANPENSMTNTSTTPTTTDWSCNYAAGTCVDPKGNINYCVFAGAGTSASPYTRSSCVPAAGDSDGDGVPNDRDTAPNDPLNGKDTTGTESDNVSSGGGSCSSPPVSAGDGIAAQIAYQTWATRCAVEALKAQVVANNVSGGALSPADSAKLTAIQNATGAMSTNTAVTANNTAAIASSTAASATSNATTAANTTAMKNILNGTETSPNPDTGSDSGSSGLFVEHELGANLDMSGLTGGPGACPSIPDVMVMQQLVHIDITTFCEWVKLGSLLVVLSAVILSLKILGS